MRPTQCFRGFPTFSQSFERCQSPPSEIPGIATNTKKLDTEFPFRNDTLQVPATNFCEELFACAVDVLGVLVAAGTDSFVPVHEAVLYVPEVAVEAGRCH